MAFSRVKLSCLGLALMAGCANPSPPMPHPVIIYKPLYRVSAPLAPQANTYTPTQHTNFVAWQYPTNIDPMHFCWTLLYSTDMVHWETNIPGCVTDPLWGFATNSRGFWRLKGDPISVPGL